MSSLHLMTESSVSPYLNTFSMIIILYLIYTHFFKNLYDSLGVPISFRLDLGHDFSFLLFFKGSKEPPGFIHPERFVLFGFYQTKQKMT